MKRVLKHKAIIILSALAFCGLWINPACVKIDTPPMLEIRVVDIGGNPQEGIVVGLFDELDEWSMQQNPVQAWRETDKQGKVRFIDLQEIAYYIFADGDSVNNLGNKVRLDEALKYNEQRQLTVTVE